jgi:hypothetical protein
MIYTENKNQSTTTDLCQSSPSRILLATSNLETVELFGSQAVNYRSISMAGVSTAEDLQDLLRQDPPDLLLLGTIENCYWFDLCYATRQTHENLPIVVIANHHPIEESFRRWAEVRGATDVVKSTPGELNRLFERWPQLKTDREDHRDLHLTRRVVRQAVNAIAEFSQFYFGPLAQGHYWRKTHARLQGEYPDLKYWSADHFGKIECHEVVLDYALTQTEILGLRLWVNLFIQECERVVVDFGKILAQSYLFPLTPMLLFTQIK